MENSEVVIGNVYTFTPPSQMVGWTLDLFQVFKHQDESPQDFANMSVKVLYWADEECSFAVHFTRDDPSEYFYLAAMFMEELICSCTSQNLFNFGCKCGALAKPDLGV